MYKGSVARIIAGRGGFDGNINNFQKPITSLERATNIRFDGFTWTRSRSLTSFEDSTLSGTPTCLAGHDWRPTSSTQRMITVWDDGKVYKEVSGDIDAVTLDTISPTSTVTLVEGRDDGSIASRELYIFGEGITPEKFTGDGTSMSSITNEAADWSVNKPLSAVYHDYRLYAFGVSSAAHNIYISDVSDNGDFSGGDSKASEIYPGVGDKIVAAMSYRPQELLVFKYPVGIMAIDTSDLSGSLLDSNVLSREVGMAGPHAVVKVGADVIFVSSNGRLYSLQALRPDLNPIDADITAKLNLETYIRDNVDTSKLNTARLIYDEYRKELIYTFTSKGSTTNDTAIIFDLNEPDQIKAAIENRGEYFQAMWHRQNSNNRREVMTAGATGRVYTCNDNGNSIDGVGYTSELQTVPTDLSYTDRRLQGRVKRFDMGEINYIPEGDVDIEVDIIVDGKLIVTKTLTLSGYASQFDSAVFDEDVFAGQSAAVRRFPIDLCGTFISFRIRSSEPDETFNIVELGIEYKVLGHLGEV